MEEIDMGFCINCGQEFADGAKFCANCGKAVNALQNETNSQRKTVYSGELHKCPNCGERLDSFVTTCPGCGYELRGSKVTSVVNELAQKLESTASNEQKIDLIRNFYIPNTKEDILEFFILATSNMNVDGYDVEAWHVKLEQAYQKARLSFGNTPEFQHLSQLYNNAKKQQSSKSFVRSITKSKMLQSLFLGGLGIIFMTIGWVFGSRSGEAESPFDIALVIGFFLFVVVYFINRKTKITRNKKDNSGVESKEE